MEYSKWVAFHIRQIRVFDLDNGEFEVPEDRSIVEMERELVRRKSEHSEDS